MTSPDLEAKILAAERAAAAAFLMDRVYESAHRVARDQLHKCQEEWARLIMMREVPTHPGAASGGKGGG